MLMDFESLKCRNIYFKQYFRHNDLTLRKQKRLYDQPQKCQNIFFHSIFFCWWGTTLKLTLELIGAKS